MKFVNSLAKADQNSLPLLLQKGLGAFSLLFGICLLTYWNSLNNAFLIDDYDLILSNGKFHNMKQILYEFFPFLSPAGSRASFYYRPLAHVLPIICYHFFQDNPFGYHVVNLILFSFSCFSIFHLTSFLFNSRKLAMLVSVLFAVHPINSLVVNYASAGHFGLQTVAMSYACLTFMAFLKNRQHYHNLIISLLLYIVANLCHDTAIILPVYLFSIGCLVFEKEIKTTLLLLVPHTTIALIFIILRLSFSSSVSDLLSSSSLSVNSMLIYLATATKLLLWYLSKLLLLKGVVIIWMTAAVNTDLFMWGLLFLILISTLVAVIIKYKSSKEISLGASWLLINWIFIAVGSQYGLSHGHGYIIEPHWLYFPSLGSFIILAWGLLKLRRHVTQRLFSVLLAVVFGASLFRTIELNELWGNEKKYCQYWAQETHGFTIPLSFLASAYIREKDYTNARKTLYRALDYDHKQPMIHYKLGTIDYLTGDIKNARAHFQSTLKLYPKAAWVYYSMALIDIREKNLEAAEKNLKQALSQDPSMVEAQRLLSKLIR